MTHHTSGHQDSGVQSGMGGANYSPVDNGTYNLISVLHTKLEGLKVYETYMKDADDECRRLYQELQNQDAQAAKKVMDHLKKHVQGTAH